MGWVIYCTLSRDLANALGFAGIHVRCSDLTRLDKPKADSHLRRITLTETRSVQTDYKRFQPKPLEYIARVQESVDHFGRASEETATGPDVKHDQTE